MFSIFLFIISVLLATSVYAAEPGQEESLPPVVVISTRLQDVEEEASKVPGKVIVITAEEIRQLGAKTVQEVLQYQTGVVLYDQIGNEFQPTIDFRGFNGQPVPATTVFVDGVRVNEPDFNSTNFNLIPIEDVERIEIMPGTATVFGRNGLGGVINIRTKRGRKDKPHVGLEIGGGSYGRQKYSFTSDGPLPLDKFDYYVSTTRELTDGFREASGGRITRIFGKLGFKYKDKTDATLSYTHVEDHLKQAGSLPAGRLRRDYNDNLTPGDFSDSNLHLAALNVRQKLPAGFSLALNGFVRMNDQESFVRGLSSVSTLLTETTSGGATIQATHDGVILGRKNLLSLGAEYARNRFNIVNSGLFFPAFSFLTRQSTKEDVAGAYLTDSFNLFDSLVLSGGVRYDWDRYDFTDKIDPTLSGGKIFRGVSPKAGLVFTPIKDLSFSFNYSAGVRMPTVSEIFAQGPFVSNPDLVPMTSRNFELGAKGKIADWLEASLALFYMPVKDEILFVITDPVNFFGRNENIGNTLRKGIELSLKGRYRKWLDGFLNYTVTKATFETDVLLSSGQVKKGDELPMVPRHRVGLGINLHPVENLTVSLLGNYVGRQFFLNDEPNRFRKLEDYFVLGSRVSYRWKDLTGYLMVNNLTNQKYSTSGIKVAQPFLVPAPRINLFAGLIYRY